MNINLNQLRVKFKIKQYLCRFLLRKKYQEAITVITEGIDLMIKHNQISCAVELCVVLIEAFKTSKTSVEDGASTFFLKQFF